MLDLQFDLREFQRAARSMQAAVDQVPFALANTLNEAAKVTRQHEIGTVWPGHVQVRNRGFLGAALRTEFASKRNLIVSIYDRLRHVELRRLEAGGTKRPTRSGKLAVPSRNVRRTSKGVVARQKLAALPNSFRRGDSIFQRIGGKKTSRIQLMYSLRPAAAIRPTVPFHAEFTTVMRREVRSRFGPAMKKAMLSRR